MQRKSCGRDQWQQNAHGPNSLNYVTTRSSSQESLGSRARSSTHVDFKRLPRNEAWTKTFLLQRQFLWKRMLFKTTRKVKRDFLRRSKNQFFCFWKNGFFSKTKKIEKWLKNFCSFQMSNDRNSENIFLEGFKQVFLTPKKGLVILFERTRLKKKRVKQKNGDRTKKVLQKWMNKWKKFCFSGK